MKHTTTKQNRTRKPATPGFAIEIKDDTELCDAMLIAEDEDGHYEPVAGVISINEAREIAQSNLRYRMDELERGGDPGLCPYQYTVWARGILGRQCIAAKILATSL